MQCFYRKMFVKNSLLFDIFNALQHYHYFALPHVDLNYQFTALSQLLHLSLTILWSIDDC